MSLHKQNAGSRLNSVIAVEHTSMLRRPLGKMKPRTQFLLIVGILVLILGSAWYMYPGRQPEPARDYVATIQQDCAPWDGAAFAVKIPLENGENIEIAIWEAPAIQFEKTF